MELASRSLEEKAEQLQLISKYKSEFLANMSHELRTPLNSLLILSKMLAENRNGNLTAGAGEVRDHGVTRPATICSGSSTRSSIYPRSRRARCPSILVASARLGDVRDYLEQTFRHVAEQKLALVRHPDGRARPVETVFTDVDRLQQILKNLLSNAFKFTATGGVSDEESRA